MAYIRASQGGSGGDEGTLIWTNPNSTLTLASGQITLSSNLSNFSKIRIKWYAGGASAVTRDETKEMEVIIPVSEIPIGVSKAPAIGAVVSNVQYRYFYRNSGDADNTLRNTGTIGSAAVPYKIYGIA